MTKKPEVIVMCGSSRFIEQMAVCAWLIEREESAITMGMHLLPGWYCAEHIPDHLAEHEGVAELMDELHLKKIDLCDGIFVVNCELYIGASTYREIEYATEKGLPIRYYSDDPIGHRTEKIIKEAMVDR